MAELRMAVGKQLLNDKSSPASRENAGRAARLRKYRPADLPELYDIDRRCFPPGIAYSPEEISQIVGRKDSVTLVAAAENGRIAGFVTAHLQRRGRAHLVTIDLLPAWRRRGVGRRLLLACQRRLRAAGAQTVWLETAVGNEAAQALYASLGYTRVRRLLRYYPNGEDAWLMRKELPNRRRPAA
jgi:ribosomal-protein-alanine N-acetyltransferase